MNAIFYVLRTGMPWRDLPARYGPYTTAYNRFNRWSRRGIWKRIFDQLASKSRDSLYLIDSTIVKAHRAASGAKGGRKIRRSVRSEERLNSSHLGISYAVFCLKKRRTAEDGGGNPAVHARGLRHHHRQREPAGRRVHQHQHEEKPAAREGRRPVALPAAVQPHAEHRFEAVRSAVADHRPNYPGHTGRQRTARPIRDERRSVPPVSRWG